MLLDLGAQLSVKFIPLFIHLLYIVQVIKQAKASKVFSLSAIELPLLFPGLIVYNQRALPESGPVSYFFAMHIRSHICLVTPKLQGLDDHTHGQVSIINSQLSMSIKAGFQTMLLKFWKKMNPRKPNFHRRTYVHRQEVDFSGLVSHQQLESGIR